jgi:hypothetical protein
MDPPNQSLQTQQNSDDKKIEEQNLKSNQTKILFSTSEKT